jgi:hypothetical protein
MCQKGVYKWMGYGDLRKGIAKSSNDVLKRFGSEEPEAHFTALISREVSLAGTAR